MKVQVIKRFFLNRQQYKPGDVIDVTREQALRLAKEMVIKYKVLPVAHKMVTAPKNVKEA